MVSLNDIIKGQLNEREDETSHNYTRLMRIAIDGLKDLYVDVSGVSKVIPLTVDTNTWTANIPSDYITKTRVSVCIRERLFPLMEDNNICLNRETDDCGNPATYVDFPNLTGANNGTYWHNSQFYKNTNYRVGEFIGRGYGQTGGHSAYGRYRMDVANGWIQFQMLTHFDHVVLEYLANPAMINGQFFVEQYDVEALNAYIYWGSIRSLKSVSGGEKERAAREYDRQRSKAQQRHFSPTLDELYQAHYKTFQSAPKL